MNTSSMFPMNRLYPAEFVYSSVFMKGRGQTGMTAEDSVSAARHRRHPNPVNNNSDDTYSSFKEGSDLKEDHQEEGAIDPFTRHLSWSSLTFKQKFVLIVGRYCSVKD